MLEVMLICLGILWLGFASIQDLRSREVANWIGFSLIIFSLSFRFFFSLFEKNNFNFFYQGLIGLGIFFVIGNLFYYSRVFAGGDAKLMIALGPVIGFSENFFINLKIYFLFLFLFLIAGGVYGGIWSLVLALKNFSNFKKQYKKLFQKNKKLIYFVLSLGILILVFGFYFKLFFLIGIFIFLIPYFYLFAKSVDESCMVKKVFVKNLAEGDWLYKNIFVGRKLIKTRWQGLEKDEIQILKKNKNFKNKKILIRQGIAFVPVFLIAFLVLVGWWIFRNNWIF